MSWFQKLIPSRISTFKRKRNVPEGVWIKCPKCDAQLYRAELERNLKVCPKCKFHTRIGARDRLEYFLDKGKKQELAENIVAMDPLKFRDTKKYSDRISQAQNKTNEKEALVVMVGNLLGEKLVACSFDFGFLGGSMGSVVGERFCQAIDYCIQYKLPLVVFSCSGGARMQESAFSLMQLAKTSSKLAKFHEDGGLFIPILTDPTTGGVTASFGMLGDIILAEPGALIGFAGPRVIKQTIGQDLPQGFQRSEFLLEKGFIDQIVTRNEMKDRLHQIIDLSLIHI